ncbi:hypothetical protein OM274_25060, partial [Escherichia albertii]|nr:hypothetical protein [Escherichia albertii]MCZ9179201.1 hypothetical protein [Escherichia albertii]
VLNTIPPLLFLKESLGGLLGWVVSDCVRVFMEWQTVMWCSSLKQAQLEKNYFDSFGYKGVKFCIYAFFTYF